jgi:hypothetical protein
MFNLLGSFGYLDVVILVASMALIGFRTYSKAQATRTLAQLVRESQSGMAARRDPRAPAGWRIQRHR